MNQEIPECVRPLERKGHELLLGGESIEVRRIEYQLPGMAGRMVTVHGSPTGLLVFGGVA
jgi:hypothetical protein